MKDSAPSLFLSGMQTWYLEQQQSFGDHEADEDGNSNNSKNVDWKEPPPRSQHRDAMPAWERSPPLFLSRDAVVWMWPRVAVLSCETFRGET